MKNQEALSAEEIACVVEYCEVLRDIHDRVAQEGYFLDLKRRIWDIFKIVKPLPYDPKKYKPEDYEP